MASWIRIVVRHPLFISIAVAVLGAVTEYVYEKLRDQ